MDVYYVNQFCTRTAHLDGALKCSSYDITMSQLGEEGALRLEAVKAVRLQR